MLSLAYPDVAELEAITVFRAECRNCTFEETVEAGSIEEAAEKLNGLGWKAYETDDEACSIACKACIRDLQAIEERTKE